MLFALLPVHGTDGQQVLVFLGTKSDSVCFSPPINVPTIVSNLPHGRERASLYPYAYRVGPYIRRSSVGGL